MKKPILAGVIAGFLFLVGATPPAHAAYTANPRQPTTYWMDTGGNWQSSVTFEARASGSPTKYLKRTVPVSKASLGKLAKLAMGGPVTWAVTAAMVGYAVWEATSGEFMGGGSEPAPDTTGTTTLYSGQAIQNQFGGPINFSGVSGTTAACGVWAAERGLVVNSVTSENLGADPTPTCKADYNGSLFTVTFGSISTVTGCPSGYSSNGTGGCTLTDETLVDGYEAPTALTEEQVGEQIASSSTATRQVLDDAIDRGTWAGNWPELDQAATDVATALDRVEAGTATQDDLDLERTAQETAAETQAIPDDYAREPTLQAVKEEATAIKNNTQALVDTLGNDGSNLPPWQPPTLPADPVPDWDYTGQFTAFWDWAKGLFPFSFLLSPLTAFGGTAPPPLPDFSITVLGNTQTLSLQPVSVVFTWIRAANGILLLFGFYLIGLSIARRFI